MQKDKTELLRIKLAKSIITTDFCHIKTFNLLWAVLILPWSGCWNEVKDRNIKVNNEKLMLNFNYNFSVF